MNWKKRRKWEKEAKGRRFRTYCFTSISALHVCVHIHLILLSLPLCTSSLQPWYTAIWLLTSFYPFFSLQFHVEETWPRELAPSYLLASLSRTSTASTVCGRSLFLRALEYRFVIRSCKKLIKSMSQSSPIPYFQLKELTLRKKSTKMESQDTNLVKIYRSTPCR